MIDVRRLLCMRAALSFWRSSIGGKVTMAVTGALLFLFVVAHLLGNLQLFSGPEALNDYAALLASRPLLLWCARIGLLLVFLVHVATGVRLARQNRAARPVGYECEATRAATMASRSMVLSGVGLLLFVVYHLLHFTLGVTSPAHYARKLAGAGGHDVHAMVVAGFREPAVALVYVSFQLVLFLHLAHGLQSFVQTLGVLDPRWTRLVRGTSLLLAGLIAGGNALLPIAVLAGVVGSA
jgi:succinate dehydrogenase / fumarate reductase cytochrome b subunit